MTLRFNNEAKFLSSRKSKYWRYCEFNHIEILKNSSTVKVDRLMLARYCEFNHIEILKNSSTVKVDRLMLARIYF